MFIESEVMKKHSTPAGVAPFFAHFLAINI